MRSWLGLVSSVAVVALACGAAEKPTAEPATERSHTEVTMVPASMPDRAMGVESVDLACPMDLPKVSVEAVTVPRGAALVFRVDPNTRSELRSRVELLADRHRSAGRYEVKLESFAGGVRLVLIAEAEKLEELRQASVRYADAMTRTGRCPLTL